jgi:hypothetical protein
MRVTNRLMTCRLRYSRTRDKKPKVAREGVKRSVRNKSLSYSFYCPAADATVGHVFPGARTMWKPLYERRVAATGEECGAIAALGSLQPRCVAYPLTAEVIAEPG